MLDEVPEVLEHILQLRQPVLALPEPTGVPVGGVKDPHQRFIRANGSGPRVAAATSLARVAQEGNGNRSRIAIGISGCATIIEPGRRSVARTRPTSTEKAVLVPLGLGCIQPADHLERGVRDDPALNLTCGLLRAEQRDTQRTTAFGDIEKQAVERAPPFARRVLVQLVKDDEHERSRAALLLLLVHHSLQAERRPRTTGRWRAANGCRRR